MMRFLASLPLILLCGCVTTTDQTTEVPATKPAHQSRPEVMQSPPVVEIQTNFGDIDILLYDKKSPKTVKNFLDYVKDKHYDGTIFHRVIGDFMIQGGGFTLNFTKKHTRRPIKNEAENGLSNKRGTIAMARTSEVDSATDQFFINLRDNRFLDNKDHSAERFGYCVFGKVIKGMDVVDRIARVKTTRKGYFNDLPAEPVVIKRVLRIK